jgi:hypothetical protein
MQTLNLQLLPGEFAICQLDADQEIPGWASLGTFHSITRTPDELSILCARPQIPDHIPCQPGWRLLMIEGPFEFDEIGVLAAITTPLAQAGISLLTISTYDTDYILIQQDKYNQAVKVLETAGHRIDQPK